MSVSVRFRFRFWFRLRFQFRVGSDVGFRRSDVGVGVGVSVSVTGVGSVIGFRFRVPLFLPNRFGPKKKKKEGCLISVKTKKIKNKLDLYICIAHVFRKTF